MLAMGIGLISVSVSMAVAAQSGVPPVGKREAIVPEWLSGGRSDYFEHCAGCHGVGGTSAPAKVPELLNRVGYFMCTPEARDYLVKLPNVAHAKIDDPGELANLVNYVVFVIGGDSVPPNAEPFTADEVARLRTTPIANRSLINERSRLVSQIVKRCGAPASLNQLYEGAPSAAPQ